MKSPINSFFDKVYVLSLPQAKKNRKRITDQLSKLAVQFEFFNATDGYSSIYDREWNFYTSRPLATKSEEKLARKLITSRGAWGCLYSYKFLIQEICRKSFETVLILEDDCLFSRDFNKKFISLVNDIPSNWKALLLGASQYGWENEIPNEEKYYYPTQMDTKGAFAVGYRREILREILEELQKMKSAYDHFPLGNIYNKYKNQCFVAFPNLVIADVRKSYIRRDRDMIEHSSKMRWKMEDYHYNE